jgi:hypothetical protein
MSFFNPSNSRDWTHYVIPQTDPRVVPNTAGVITTTGGARIRVDSVGLSPGTPELNPQNYKTGSSSSLVGIPGRVLAQVPIKMPFIPSGAAGTKPDFDLLLQSIFGQAPTVSAGVSVTYAYSDAILFSTILAYNKTPGLTAARTSDMYAFGWSPLSWELAYNGTEFTLTLNGQAINVASKRLFSVSYTGTYVAAKGGLTTYPVEPSFSTNGQSVPAFGGVFTLGGGQVFEVVGPFTVGGTTGINYQNDGYLDAFALTATRGLRTTYITCKVLDTDSTILQTLSQATFSKAPLTLSLSLGATAGQIVTVNMTNIQLPAESWSETESTVEINYNTATAHETTAGAKDDLTIVLS